MILNEEQLKTIIMETAISVLTESVLGDFLKTKGLTVMNSEDGKKYVLMKVTMGKGTLRNRLDMIRTNDNGMAYMMVNPRAIFSRERIRQTRKYGDVDTERMINTFDTVVRKIESRGREMCREMEKEMKGYVKVVPKIYKGNPIGATTQVPIWDDGKQWGSYIQFFFTTTARKRDNAERNQVRQATYDWLEIRRSTKRALAAMKKFFNENAETDEEFENICQTKLDGNRWIVQFNLDEEETINGMIAEAEYETGKKAMTSPGVRDVFIFKL